VKNSDNNNKGFYTAIYVTAIAFLMIAFGVTMANTKSIAEKNKAKSQTETTTQHTASAENEELAPVGKSDVKSYTEATTQATTKQITEKATEPATQKKTAEINEVITEPNYTLFDSEKEMIWPVEGAVVMDYSVETAIFDKTLEQYHTNDSICISAPVGTNVVAAADGVVTSIRVDELNGVTVSMDNGNGWSTTYSQLRNDISLSEGQVVYQGDTIGQVEEPTDYSVELGPHLRFTVSEENKTVDPKTVLATQDE
jgi:murein DD-endopeptidase MepM/ murein hydrolase activator NlpD